MDYMLERERIAVGEILFDGCQEQPIDIDVNLPDYCPDIQRILKCQIYPKISSRSITGDRLMLDGSYTVKIFYLDPEGKCVRCHECDDSYTAEIALKQQAENAMVSAFARVEYVNCRASSPRRLNVHGSFSLCAKVISTGQCEMVSNICGSDVEQQKLQTTANELVGFAQQQFSVDEVLELGQGKPPADAIVRSDAYVVLQDCKIAAGKLMTKGEANVKFLYRTVEENGELETMEYSLPFTQMLDCDGVTDDCTCFISMNVVSADAQIKNDYSGDKTFFDTQVKISATAKAYRQKKIVLVNDAFSRSYDMNIDAKQRTMESFAESVQDTVYHKAELTQEGTAITKVIDVWSEMASATASFADGKMKLKGKYNLCVLARNEQNAPFYFERMIDFEHELSCSAEGDLKCEPEVTTGAISYRISGSGIEIKTEIFIRAEIVRRITFKSVTAVTADETKPVARDTSASLCLYFADAGESVWDIAREYRTSMASVCAENGITGDVVENRGMLLIPM
jgi:hypothetical protein